MCSRYRALDYSIAKEFVDALNAKEAFVYEPIDDAETSPYHLVFPGDTASIITPSFDGDKPTGLNVREFKWGYSVDWNNTPVFNTRFETAMKDEGRNMWRESIEQRRCLIPSMGFYEPHKSETIQSEKTGKPIKQNYLFTLPQDSLMFIVGVFNKDNEYSMMTTRPNKWVSDVHNRMPRVLDKSELMTWLFGNYETVFDRSGLELIAQKE